MKTYELSLAADSDLNSIFEYTLKKHSSRQAETYLKLLEEVFERIVLNPEIGKDRAEIKKDLKSISIESHIIFYRILSDKIRIVRVLHHSRDLKRFL